MIKRIPVFMLVLVSPVILGQESSIFDCREISDIEKRVACYDAVVDSPRMKPSGKKQINSVENSVPDLKPDSEELFGMQESEAHRIVKKSLAMKQLDKIEAEVAAVKKSSTRKLTITLANGQIWQQLDSGPMKLKKGEIIVVRSARLGSFLLSKKSGSGSIRVKRRD